MILLWLFSPWLGCCAGVGVGVGCCGCVVVVVVPVVVVVVLLRPGALVLCLRWLIGGVLLPML